MDNRETGGTGTEDPKYWTTEKQARPVLRIREMDSRETGGNENTRRHDTFTIGRQGANVSEGSKQLYDSVGLCIYDLNRNSKFTR